MRHNLSFFAAVAAVVVSLAGASGAASCQQQDAGTPGVAGPQPSATTSSNDSIAVFSAHAQRMLAPTLPDAPEAAEVNGTVTDVNDDLIPGATVVLDGVAPQDHRNAVANDSGIFQFSGLRPGVPYRVTISAKGFENWVSPPITLAAGQFFGVPDIKLKLEASVSSVTVYSSTEQIAAHQVQLEEQQRIMGFIPNFHVVYDPKHAVPLTTKLKFQMAYRASIDPVSILGAAMLAGMNQAGDTPDYRQGAIGYGERFGAAYTDGLTDTMFGGAILPSLLHQDPRYFYQGTGTLKSRLLHAMAAPFVCRGDNGRNEVNISSIGGDLISSAISNAYYPQSNRGVGLTFENLGLSTGERSVSTIVQEFLLRKLTPSAKDQN
jgi:hypothetical protein